MKPSIAKTLLRSSEHRLVAALVLGAVGLFALLGMVIHPYFGMFLAPDQQQWAVYLVAIMVTYCTGLIMSLAAAYAHPFRHPERDRLIDLSLALAGITFLLPLQSLGQLAPEFDQLWWLLSTTVAAVVLYVTCRAWIQGFFSPIMSHTICVLTSAVALIASTLQKITATSNQGITPEAWSPQHDIDIFTYFLATIGVAVWISCLYNKLRSTISPTARLLPFTPPRSRSDYVFYTCLTIPVALAAALEFGLDQLLAGPARQMSFQTLHLTGIGMVIYSLMTLIRQPLKLKIKQPIGQPARLALDTEETRSNVVGMRSANFFIDHDPDDDISSRYLPALTQIRSLEIQRYLAEILKDKLFYEKALKNQLFGSIHPRQSNRPCIDALNLFATMYLIAMPAVENRIRNLIRLLPIIDPDIASSLPASVHADAEKDARDPDARAVDWLFHFDYSWINELDMSINGDRHSSVEIDNMKLSTRYKILGYLYKKIPMGNFIWIGEEARSRIIMEAPFLSNIIETWPISLEENQSEVVFLIKFYDLIPRLKKYYNLGQLLERVKPYEPTFASQRFLTQIRTQLTEVHHTKDMEALIDKLGSFTFKGYSEKDEALEVALAIYARCQKNAQDDTLAEDVRHSWKLLIHASLRPALTKIGYPSQIHHVASKSQRFIREPESLMTICLKPTHEKFESGWLFLATVNPKQYETAQIGQLLDMIHEASRQRSLQRDPMIMRKMIEAFFNVAAHAPKGSALKIQATLDSLFGAMAGRRPEPELVIFFLDAKLYLEEQTKTTYAIDPHKLWRLKLHLQKLSQQLGKDDGEIKALRHRWDLLLAQIDTSTGASRIAS